MRYRATDDNGDMRPVIEPTNLLSGKQAVAAALSSRLRLYHGEWWEDSEEGFLLLDSVLSGQVKPNNLQGLDHLITGYIMETQGVIEVKNVKIDCSGRQLRYQCTVVCSDGVLQLEVNENGVQSAVS